MSIYYFGFRNSFAGNTPSVGSYGSRTSFGNDWNSKSYANYNYHQPTYRRASVNTADLPRSSELFKGPTERSKQANFSKMDVSKTRQKIRKVICKARNDPKYFDY